MALSFLPGEQRDYTIVPIDKGMVRNAPPHMIPPGGFYDVEGFIVNQQGLYRRPGFGAYAQQNTVPFKMVDMATLWRTNGSQVVVLITEDLVYKVSRLSGLSGLWWLYTTGTVTHSGTDVTGSGMDWTGDGITSGDYIAIDSGAETTSMTEITTVTGSGTLVVDGSLGVYDGANYEIRRSLNNSRPKLSDWAVHLNKLIIASYEQPLLYYDPGVDDYLHKYVTGADLPTTGEFKANAVCSFGDRVWVGGLDDGTDSERQQRIRWSTITDPQDFSVATAYTDLPYSSGEILRMIPMGRILVVYLEDALYFGTMTNWPTQPVQFDRVETGRIGLIGPRAICAFRNGHFFVGQDDVYYVNQGGVQPIGSPVLRETIYQCDERWRIYAVADPKNTRIVFGFPTDKEYIEKTWSFDYRTKAWSYDEIETDMIASPQITETVTWGDLGGFTWADIEGSYPEWGSFTDEPSEVNFFIEHSNALFQLTESRATDIWDSGTAIPVTLETGDLDLGAPDEMKHYSRLSVRLHSSYTYANKISFTAQISMDSGNSWKGIGTLEIYAGHEEGYVNFRASGSIIRIRLTSSSEVQPYWIDSLVLRAASRGKEHALGAQDDIS